MSDFLVLAGIRKPAWSLAQEVLGVVVNDGNGECRFLRVTDRKKKFLL